jgi:hypothetical protein
MCRSIAGLTLRLVSESGTPDHPWFSALLREFRAHWWVRAVLVFVVVFALDHFAFGNSLARSLMWAGLIAAVNPVVTYFRHADWR